jgi:hypothetical protein
MRIPLLPMFLLVATQAALAQIPIVATQTLRPAADDLFGENPQFADPEFGAAVAIDGNRLAVGMPGYNEHVGRVGIYHRTTTGWRRTATLSPSSPDDVFFGGELDIDGHILAVGARGAAYLFAEQTDGTWRQIGRVTTGNRDLARGSDLAYDNGILAVGQVAIDENGNELPGSVSLYRRCAEHGVHPTPVARLRASDGSTGNGFGESIAMERGVLVAGAPGAAAAYVFVRSNLGWAQRQKLMGSTATPSSQFGTSVALRDRQILVGAPYLNLPGDENTTSPEGNAYVFLPSGSGWFESQALNDDGRFFALFGQDVAMGRGMAAITAPIEEAVMSTHGAALAFEWVGEELIRGQGGAAIPEGWFATDLAFSGRTLVLGLNEAEFAAPNQFGRVTIVEYAQD